MLGSVIVGVAVLFASFKVFFELIKTYVAVLVQIIFSPIILMFGAIPGKNTFGKWVKDLTGNLLVWPVVLLCILVQRMLTAPIRAIQGTGNTLDSAFGGGFMPPFLVGQGQGSILPVIIGLGVLLVIPEIIQQVKKAMGVEEGVFGALAQAAGGKLKPYMNSALPVGGTLVGGAWQGREAYKDFVSRNPKNAGTWSALKVAIAGDEKLGIKGALHGAQKGWSAGQEANTFISDVGSGQVLRKNPADELIKRLKHSDHDDKK
jgi:hypothetical protein